MQTNNLQIAPIGIMPIIHASQYDFGRQIKFILYDGSSAYVPPTGAIINVEGKKSDGNAFSYACTYSGNEVTFTLAQQMTVLAEIVECELRIIDSNSSNIGTLNFKLDVEASPINGDTPISDTEIPAIIELAEAQVDMAEGFSEDAEAWAKGTRDGVPVSSSDPTYHNNAKYYAENVDVRDFTGATASAPGTHGLVPAPAAGAQDKFLKGDGTWGDVGAMSIDDEAKTRGILGAKNLNVIPYAQDTSTTMAGITWTLNDDGTVIANGTSTDMSYFDFHNRNVNVKNPLFLENGNYIVSGCPDNGSLETYYISIGTTKNGSFYTLGRDFGEGVEITVNGSDEFVDKARIQIQARIAQAGVTVSNLVFKPMIRLATDSDSTYQPYAMTNKELTESCYSKNDTTETTIDDADYIPFYDSSAGTQKKILVSNLNLGGSSVTVLTKTLAAGSTSVTFTNIPTTGDYLVDFYTSTGVPLVSIDTTTSGQVTVDFQAQASNITVFCRIEEVS